MILLRSYGMHLSHADYLARLTMAVFLLRFICGQSAYLFAIDGGTQARPGSLVALSLG